MGHLGILPASLYAEFEIRGKLEVLGSQCQVVLLWVNQNIKLKDKERGGDREGEREGACASFREMLSGSVSTNFF